MKLPQSNSGIVFVVLFVCLLFRALTLEHPDLVDPTESRYAFVAQEMFLSGDWVVPKLPLYGTTEPYLGKPPLHFWLAATGFSLLGMDEWVARLPSFLGLVVMCTAVFSMRGYGSYSSSAPLASLMLASSGLLYFLAGASVVDVTLAAWITVGFVSAFAIVESHDKKMIHSIIFFSSLALGFLTKGPVALVLVGVAAVGWLAVTRRVAVLRNVSWFAGLVTFTAITIPWFIAAQQRNSDFLRYFFVNENFGRYLLEDYGDRYGSGHRYPFGTIWGMLIVGFLPWSIPAIIVVLKDRSTLFTRAYWREHQDELFFLLWAVSPCIFFTFARQLHTAYVLPGLPGLSLLTAQFVCRLPVETRAKFVTPLATLMIALGSGALVLGLFLGTSLSSLVYALVPLAVLGALAINLRKRGGTEIKLALGSVAAYAVTTLVISAHVGERRSTESILRCLTRYAPEPVPQVAILDANNYSLYFYSRAWEEELTKPVQLRFVLSTKLPTILPSDLIVPSGELAKVRLQLPTSYEVKMETRKWTWLRTSGAPITVEGCPADA